MCHIKIIALPFLVSELLPFGLFFTDYPCAHTNSMRHLDETL